MRRFMIGVTAMVAMLVAAASAYAAINTYTAKVKFTTTKVGTSKKAVPIGFTEDFTAKGTNGNRTALLEDIKTTVYGVKATNQNQATCPLSKIASAKNDTVCPKGALLASGYIHAEVGSPTDFTAAAAPCNPALDVWNGGGGKATFFFVDTPAHNCNALGLKTGDTGPYPGTMKQKGKNLVLDTPIPSFINRPVGLAGSLLLEHLVYAKTGKTTKGKNVTLFDSVACQKKSRPYSVSFTANLPTTNTTETKVLSGKAPC